MRRPPGLGRRTGFRGIGSGSFSRQSIGDLVLWLKADTGITLNGSDVSAWADQSGQGNNAAQATALNQPVYTASNAAFGGAPSVDFHSAATEYMTITSAASLEVDAVKGFSLFIVCNVPSGAANNAVAMGKWGSDLSWRMRYASGVGTEPLWSVRDAADTGNVSVQWSSTVINAGALVLHGHWEHVDGVNDITQIRVNSGTAVEATGAGSTTSTEDVAIGATATGASPGDIEIAEILIYQRKATNGQDAQLVSLLASEYGL